MDRLRLAAWLLCAASICASGAGRAVAAPSCEGLTSIALQGGAVTAAHLIAAGRFEPSPPSPGAPEDTNLYEKLPAFCRVEATLKPSSDSDIRMEVWLPAADWNGKLVETGNGAFSPALSYKSMAEALAAGYAATGSNTGHEQNSAAFAVGHPEKIIDFGYRAVHVDAVAAKSIAMAFFGEPVRKAYFEGCSTGGRQA